MKTILLGIAASLALGTAYAQTSAPARTSPPMAPAPMTTAAPTAPGQVMTPTTTVPMTSTSPSGSSAASGNSNQAVATTHANAPMPAKGANSFTMSQASSRIEKEGFNNVTGLSKDADGVWRGQANKDGSSTAVWLDYKGNVGTGNIGTP